MKIVSLSPGLAHINLYLYKLQQASTSQPGINADVDADARCGQGITDFSQIHNMKTKNSSYKMFPQWGYNLGLSWTSDSKSMTLISGLTGRDFRFLI